LPSDGFIGAENVPLAQSETFARQWLEHPAPSEDQLIDAYSRAPDRR
jgi:hypothetical protein